MNNYTEHQQEVIQFFKERLEDLEKHIHHTGSPCQIITMMGAIEGIDLMVEAGLADLCEEMLIVSKNKDRLATLVSGDNRN